MRRVEPSRYPMHLREIISDVNVTGYRSKELLELLKVLLESRKAGEEDIDDESFGRLMEMQSKYCIRYLQLAEESTARILRDFDESE